MLNYFDNHAQLNWVVFSYKFNTQPLYNKKTALVDDPSDLIARVECLRTRKPRDRRSRGFRPGDNLRVLIRSLGSFLFIIYHNCQKVIPFGESCPGTHTGYRQLITRQFRLAVGWISRQYFHHYFAKIKADFAT
jgi:hypothetical protein